MITNTVQRWRAGRASYRPAGEPIATRRYEVASIDGEGADTVARTFVERHHYSGAYVAARRRYGLYRGAELVGVAVFSVPAQPRALACLPDPAAGVELGRLVLLDDVEANGESWLIGRCFELLRAEGFAGVVSFSDPEARTDAAGAEVFHGHLGTVYQATNGVYLGRTKAERRLLLPDGTVLPGRAVAKVRALDRGWRYVVARLVAHGAEPLTGDPHAWLATWLPRLTRPLQHRGNFKYAWALRRRDRRFLPASLPYPKVRCAA